MTGDDFSMMHIIIMMFVDAIIYGLLTWYIEAVFPGQYGTPRPWYFFVLKSYWCGNKINAGNLEEGLSPYFDPEGESSYYIYMYCITWVIFFDLE